MEPTAFRHGEIGVVGLTRIREGFVDENTRHADSAPPVVSGLGLVSNTKCRTLCGR